jgi:hypothetical protein
MLVLRHLSVVVLSLAFACQASAKDNLNDCGELLGESNHSNMIYVLCPSLSGLSKAEVHRIIEAARAISRPQAGKFEVVFVSDASIAVHDPQLKDMEERLASWGDRFVGVYDSSNGFLIYRSSSDGKWHKLQLEN